MVDFLDHCHFSAFRIVEYQDFQLLMRVSNKQLLLYEIDLL